ncbi:hypothetical protein SKAU_G00056660 [Synaphobranchus kaupii]|uniref:Uncharacterized protein n=1 Tax=Synaphobranchus kaupii TaxID=118154 RepID=A0A9Q1G4J5_SYNKA|nr:hypothetical protein SKAU_G00056660 [Synaphobranchus kaupii]
MPPGNPSQLKVPIMHSDSVPRLGETAEEPREPGEKEQPALTPRHSLRLKSSAFQGSVPSYPIKGITPAESQTRRIYAGRIARRRRRRHS